MYGMLSTILLPALAMALSPWSIMAMVMMLESKNGIRKAVWFNLGWTIPLVISSLSIVVLINNVDFDGGSGPSDTVGILRIVIGVGLLLMAIRMWHQARDPNRKGKPPKWMSRIKDMTPARGFFLGLTLYLINFRNFALVILAMSNILAADRGLPYVVIAWLVFLGLAGSTHWLPIWRFRSAPEETRVSLRSWNQFLSEHTVILVIMPMIIIALWQIEGGRTILTA